MSWVPSGWIPLGRVVQDQEARSVKQTADAQALSHAGRINPHTIMLPRSATTTLFQDLVNLARGNAVQQTGGQFEVLLVGQVLIKSGPIPARRPPSSGAAWAPKMLMRPLLGRTSRGII